MIVSGPIGVFDSGLGGLTVLIELAKAMPHESFVYLGDTARVPYGSRSTHIIQRYSFEDVDFLRAHKVKMIVIACNTATAHTEEMIRSHYQDLPIVGVIQPGVEALLARTRSKRVGVVGTHSTIKSGEYKRRILQKNQNVQVFTQACPLFVPLVEEGWLNKKITHLVIQEYFAELVHQEIDAVILGCTHYPLLKPAIKQNFPEIQLIDSSQETARAVQQILAREGPAPNSAQKKETRNIHLYLTDITDQPGYLKKLLSGTHFDLLEEVRL